MNLFELLVIAHFVGDWIFQTEYEAMEKAKGRFLNFAIIKHCAIYTFSFIPVFVFSHVNWLWLLLIFWSHMFLDRRWPIVWWINKVKFTSEETIKNLFWLVIVVDQITHILVLALIALFS